MRHAAWIVSAFVVLALGSCARGLDPGALVEHYVELHRSGDIDELLALHSDDAEFLIPGQEPIRRIAALRNLFEWDAVLKSELFMDSISAEGDTIVVDSVIERNKWFQAIGLSEARFQPGTRMVLKDGRIVGTYPAAFDAETQKRVAAGFERIVRWLRQYRPEALERLLPGGKFKYDAASAKLWLEVFEEWKSSDGHNG
jgi:SnoaL-like protein